MSIWKSNKAFSSSPIIRPTFSKNESKSTLNIKPCYLLTEEEYKNLNGGWEQQFKYEQNWRLQEKVCNIEHVNSLNAQISELKAKLDKAENDVKELRLLNDGLIGEVCNTE